MKKQFLKKTQTVILFTLTLFLLSSCTDEEFYEKEELITYKDEHDFNNPVIDLFGNVDDSQTTGDSNGTDENGSGDSASGDNGSGDNGSGDSGSGDSGSGDDGSGDSGSGDSGSGDNGSGDDGSGDSGSGDNGSGDDGANYFGASDDFTQNSTGQKIDILWVIDNSGSMKEEQADLAYNFDVFINEFIKKGIDFKMSITTTDIRYNNAGKPVKDSFKLLTSAKLAEDQNKFLNDFSRLVQVGTHGSMYEKGLKASEVFTNRHAINNFRKDAFYIIVYLSDEKDQSNKTPEAHLKQIQKWKDNNGLIKTYSIVNMSNPSQSSKYYQIGYERYKKMSTMTGGYVSDINEDFYSTLLNMGEEIASLTDSFPLAQTPVIEKGIDVFVDGTQVTSGWNYDSLTNTIVFEQNSLPSTGAAIKIQYKVLQ